MYVFFQPCGRLEDTLADTLDKLVTSEVLRIEESQQVCFCMFVILLARRSALVIFFSLKM